MAVITIVGAGMMGSALAVPLVDAGHDVRLVGTHLDEEIVKSLAESGVHPKLKLALPSSIRPFSYREMQTAMQGVDVIGIGVSSAGIAWASEQIKPFARPEIPVVMISKGLEWDGTRFRVLPDTIRDGWPEGIAPAAIAGPCIAGELARRVETCVVLTGRETSVLERLRSLLRTDYYHLVVSPDVIGVEVSAALKNAYAMGIAFALGLHEKRGGSPGSVAMHNYESAVFSQSVLEMQQVIRVAGGDPASATGLAGVGDLDVTTNGGRTGRFGRLLGLGLTVPEAIEAMQGATLECLEILDVMRTAMRALESRGELDPDDLPLLRHLVRVALENAPVDMPFSRFFGAE